MTKEERMTELGLKGLPREAIEYLSERVDLSVVDDGWIEDLLLGIAIGTFMLNVREL
jgi:hypothetical protein